MAIPKIIHQTWKTTVIPQRWSKMQQHNLSLSPGFEYRLWSDEMMMEFVKNKFPDVYTSFVNYRYVIMRADVIRYLLMYEIGGLYLDLDYELLVPFDVDQAPVVLPRERSIAFGDGYEWIGNAFFASVPQHKFWGDVIEELIRNPPKVRDEYDVADATGPGLLTKVYYANSYPDIYVPERILYHPPSPHTKKGYLKIKNSGESLGIHLGWGNWKERFTWKYIERKFFKNRWEAKRLKIIPR
ncbi:MAG: glycosyltransferase [Chitinophagales bacterium]